MVVGEVQRVEVDSARGYSWETRLVPVKEAGEVVAIMGIGADVTARRRLEEQMRQRHKLEALGRVTAGIAHNFNNMLTVILSNLKLLQLGARAPVLSRVAEVEHAAQRAADMVRELMVFARHRPQQPKREAIDLRQVAERAVAMCRSSCDTRIDLSVEADASLPRYPRIRAASSSAAQRVVECARRAARANRTRSRAYASRFDLAELSGETPASAAPQCASA